MCNFVPKQVSYSMAGDFLAYTHPLMGFYVVLCCAVLCFVSCSFASAGLVRRGVWCRFYLVEALTGGPKEAVTIVYHKKSVV